MKTRVGSKESKISKQYAVRSKQKTIYCLLPTAYCLLLTVFCLLSSVSYAENKDEKTPIKIRSNRMETYNEKNVVSFLENVIAEKGDMTIYANRVDVYSDKDQKKLIKIIAEGNVRIEKGGKTATGEKAEYYEEEQKLILKGTPQIKEKNNFIKGSEIIYYLKEDNISVQGDEKKKVEVTLFPEEKKSGEERN
ncbi:MAG: lipopolysaccharide transport periplasmic protein LptA [Nitrospinae bacterium RIFCSPLOWO2_02_FULL_39_110]|nr:MAG: lipopolysaccharide transport periplasmic protein LptA [Nitrospinae bacterium RIFCSPHIGHO2_02_39_11]OGV98199.1 MAG: lipopolysaccharide transport periplasmic protein LptA [Nitrospinae bacterium RIFCSPHIGHO2_12_FULL_39_42]OGV99662.1 MAG: lipopolysaccharide transport periplasmic protein LptA [Nitrospinae bacterium RIFCSPHIGHO2_02_FULL_39_82]OGW01505.1 MAG: lipopolysaccharide transport periplasmic protein LptA [Nitrospinae bacterium RIFCSPLOWO2_02_39_17]OGW03818.1 MAG: lipopolysaccharide tra